MQITMDDSHVNTVSELEVLLNGTQKIAFSLEEGSIEEKYNFIEKTIKKFSYAKLVKKDKRIVYLYLRKITGYKKAQLYRLIGRAEKGKLKVIEYQRIKPHKIYTSVDVKLLEKTDELHWRLSEDATK